MKVHVHDNNRAPVTQVCMAAHELTPNKVLTLHIHDGPRVLCPEGHCHYGSIGLTLNERGEVYVSFQGVAQPKKITLDDYNPDGKVDEVH